MAHAGLAFGAFHRYLYKPFRAGTFTNGGTRGKVVAFVKAGASALFIKREVGLASEDVKANPALCKAIAAPLASLGNSITGAVDKLKGGDASGVTDANSAIAATESGAQSSGTKITEDPPPRSADEEPTHAHGAAPAASPILPRIGRPDESLFQARRRRRRNLVDVLSGRLRRK